MKKKGLIRRYFLILDIISGLGIMLLLFALVFSQRGLIDLFNLKKENKKLDEAIRLEEQKLNENKKRISVFEKNQSMKERFIREQLGYIHEDEWLIEMQ